MPFTVSQTKRAGLCMTCDYGKVVAYDNGGTEIHCGLYRSIRVERPVVSCTGYYGKDAVSKGDMEKIAWILRTDRSGQALGFAPPIKKDEP